MLQEAGQTQTRGGSRLALNSPLTSRGVMVRFSKEMSIFEALEADAAAREIFESHGMSCCLCLGAQSESIEAGAILHQVDPDLVVGELNRLVGEDS